ncbi:MAG: cell wall-active antibiotics response protein [Ignavibacteriales bacterium]|nr:cell wall-active antibiotics response protein [Ignavibacteriales bacterium]MCF8314803.1 cell wall-active antibiotics response protein [Ignavibacteriales bacterium]MCF8436248.1 cell wall-active antibiotics response protein [Ignavibacteriales bacterium]
MKRFDPVNIVGYLLIGIGVLFFFDNLDLFNIDLSDMIFSFPTILIIIGGIILINTSGRSNFGVLLVSVGLLFHVVDYLNYPFGEFLSEYWPIIIIVIGLYTLFKKNDGGRGKYTEQDKEFTESTSEDFQDYIDEVSVFSSKKTIIKSQNFRGGKTFTLFASTQLDFYDCDIAQGEHELNITTIFGGTEIWIPEGFKIVVNVNSIFGGVDDKRYRKESSVSEETKGTLYITGLCLFGGCELKS